MSNNLQLTKIDIRVNMIIEIITLLEKYGAFFLQLTLFTFCEILKLSLDEACGSIMYFCYNNYSIVSNEACE